jgi:hypothetical protein
MSINIGVANVQQSHGLPRNVDEWRVRYGTAEMRAAKRPVERPSQHPGIGQGCRFGERSAPIAGRPAGDARYLRGYLACRAVIARPTNYTSGGRD